MTRLTVNNLGVEDRRTHTTLIQGLDFTVAANTCLGIVGESGSGKTLACKALLGLASPWLATTGEAWFDHTNLLAAPAGTLRHIRGTRIAMILQDAMTAFDPLYTLGAQMTEVLVQKTALSRKAARDALLYALSRMQIEDPANVLRKHPHQLSGGMLQRCMIALTLALEPDLIIADEPTTALDAVSQHEVINNFLRLRRITSTAVIFISHDLGAIRLLAQQVLVMHRGKRVEIGSVEEIFNAPRHPFTQYLIETRRTLTRRFNRAMVPFETPFANQRGKLAC
jgi:nickel transport system ATP-binding protein